MRYLDGNNLFLSLPPPPHTHSKKKVSKMPDVDLCRIFCLSARSQLCSNFGFDFGFTYARVALKGSNTVFVGAKSRLASIRHPLSQELSIFKTVIKGFLIFSLCSPSSHLFLIWFSLRSVLVILFLLFLLSSLFPPPW